MGGRNLPRFAKQPHGKATGPIEPGTSESLGLIWLPHLLHITKLRPEMGRGAFQAPLGKMGPV